MIKPEAQKYLSMMIDRRIPKSRPFIPLFSSSQLSYIVFIYGYLFSHLRIKALWIPTISSLSSVLRFPWWTDSQNKLEGKVPTRN